MNGATNFCTGMNGATNFYTGMNGATNFLYRYERYNKLFIPVWTVQQTSFTGMNGATNFFTGINGTTNHGVGKNPGFKKRRRKKTGFIGF